VNYYEEGNQDNERILDIFVRANEAGTQLSKSEILLYCHVVLGLR